MIASALLAPRSALPADLRGGRRCPFLADPDSTLVERVGIEPMNKDYESRALTTELQPRADEPQPRGRSEHSPVMVITLES